MAKLKPPTSRISISPLSWFPSFNPLSIAKYLKALLRNFLLFLQLSTLFKPRTPTSRLSFSFFLSHKTTTSSSALPITIAFTHNKIVLKIRQKIRQTVFATLQNELRSNAARFTSHVQTCLATCIVPRPHYSARPKRFWSYGPSGSPLMRHRNELKTGTGKTPYRDEANFCLINSAIRCKPMSDV